VTFKRVPKDKRTRLTLWKDILVWDQWKAAEAAGNKREADKLLRFLVEENLPLVRHVLGTMKMFHHKFYDDLMQAGTIGLYIAIRRFRDNGGAFGSFAFLWIRHEMQVAINQGGTMDKIHRSISPTQKALLRRAQELSDHSIEITAESLGVSSKSYHAYLANNTWPKMVFFEGGDHTATSFEHEDISGQILEALSAGGVEQLIAAAETTATVASALRELDPESNAIIDAIYKRGLSFHAYAKELRIHPKTLKEKHDEIIATLRAYVDGNETDS
jgi:RNA polymerase sigma factor (sigma-70 family)